MLEIEKWTRRRRSTQHNINDIYYFKYYTYHYTSVFWVNSDYHTNLKFKLKYCHTKQIGKPKHISLGAECYIIWQFSTEH